MVVTVTVIVIVIVIVIVMLAAMAVMTNTLAQRRSEFHIPESDAKSSVLKTSRMPPREQHLIIHILGFWIPSLISLYSSG